MRKEMILEGSITAQSKINYNHYVGLHYGLETYVKVLISNQWYVVYSVQVGRQKHHYVEDIYFLVS